MAEKNHSIVLIDDDHFLLDMYTKKFSDEGYSVSANTSVSDAIAELRGGFSAEAIVFDLVMPEMDGYALLKTLREEGLGKDAKKIVLTNQGAEEEEKKTKEAGADAYIIKATMVPSEVFNTIDTLISGERKA